MDNARPEIPRALSRQARDIINGNDDAHDAWAHMLESRADGQ